MWITNRATVNSAAAALEMNEGSELRGLAAGGGVSDTSSDERADEDGGGGGKRLASKADEREFTRHGIFCLIRVLCATLICALESVHGLPVYLVVLIMGVVSFFIDVRVPSPTHPENALAPRPLLHAIAY